MGFSAVGKLTWLCRCLKSSCRYTVETNCACLFSVKERSATGGCVLFFPKTVVNVLPFGCEVESTGRAVGGNG